MAVRDCRQQHGRARAGPRRASPGAHCRTWRDLPRPPCHRWRVARRSAATAGARPHRHARSAARQGRARRVCRRRSLPAPRALYGRTAMSNPLDRALSACAREPIHQSGAIQPHGYLISCALPDWTIRHVSANIEAVTGFAPEDMLRQSLREFFTGDLIEPIAETIAFAEAGAPPQRAAIGNIGPMAQLCDIGVHVADGLVHIEIEVQPQNASAERSPTMTAQAMISRLAGHDDADGFNQQVVEQVRQLTGYDRVMIYRFRHDNAGEVVAECRDPAMPSYMGLRYPASDIPAQARALYLRNRVRVIPDVSYVPVPIVPDRHVSGEPLDLGQHALRSVSPVHMEYLRNMDVAASTSISIVVGGRLWGLIACHHRTPRRLSPGVRASADLFGLFVSMRIAAREQQLALIYEDESRLVRDTLAMRLDAAPDPRLALPDNLDLLCRAVDSDGVALFQHGQWHTAGRAPDAAAKPQLARWVDRATAPGVLATATAGDWLGDLDGDGLAGVLAVPLDPATEDWLFFFRCEEVEEVRWAGRPDEPMQLDASGNRLGPRRSFAAWHEIVRGRSVPWSDADFRTADRLSMLLRERYRRSQLHVEVSDLRARRTRVEVRDQRERLLRLSELLDGLVHVGPDEAARLAARISVLETELQLLIASETGGR
ncbi:GAF domain-containing protein [Luteimonas yindakuii]|uniref:GAF domain-containing protein n=2 Tax=Luteimonas yindakuii TaxID=2565782 RepID=A0A4Z1R0L1_9GAMM|nr:GAF domain-containing protein [Luteimonas yindakuii]